MGSGFYHHTKLGAGLIINIILVTLTVEHLSFQSLVITIFWHMCVGFFFGGGVEGEVADTFFETV